MTTTMMMMMIIIIIMIMTTKGEPRLKKEQSYTNTPSLHLQSIKIT
jgi:hypothetical protein